MFSYAVLGHYPIANSNGTCLNNNTILMVAKIKSYGTQRVNEYLALARESNFQTDYILLMWLRYRWELGCLHHHP